MNLFRYTPSPYVATQIDLPLDFIQGQLETKQKEFDLQQASVDKAAENFLKINPGMLTKDAHDRVMQQYLPQLEKIRDTLLTTGNVSMAAPELSRFTTSLAADPEVKKIMQDAEATKLYQQGLLEGRYTDMDFANLVDAQGNVRPQLRKDEAFSPMIYAPAKYTDPVDLLKEDVQKFKADLDELPPTEWRDKEGRLITDSVSIEQLKAERIAEYVRGRQQSIVNSPTYKAWVNRTTDWGTKPMTSDLYDERVTKPLTQFAYRQIKRDRTVTNPVAAATNTNPSKTSQGPGSPENRESNNLLLPSVYVNGRAEPFRNFDNTASLSSPDEMFNEINNVNKKQAEAFRIITGVTGINGAITPQNFNNVRDYYNKFYRINDEGHLIRKDIRELYTNPTPEQMAAYNNIPEITPELEGAFNLFNNANVYRTGLQNMWESITQGRNANPQTIATAKQNARQSAFNETAGASEGLPFVTNNNYDLESIYRNALAYLNNNPSGNLAGQAQSFISKYENGVINKENYNKIFNERVKSNLVGTPEGDVYKSFENLKNRMARIEVTNLKENNELEKTLMPFLMQNKSNVRLMSTNENVWSTKGGGEEFLASVPKDDKGNLLYDNITTGFGLDPENGLVGVVSLNGKMYEFDIDDTNYDQFITQGNNEVRTKIRFYDQVYKSMQRNASTAGDFTIGNINFNFKTKGKNLATNPEFKYRYNFGEGEIETTNLGDMYAAAARIAQKDIDAKDASLKIEYLKLQDWYETQYRKINTYEQKQALDDVFQRKIKETTDQWEKQNSQTVTIGKDVGKKKQWTARPSNPLQ
jgi:hypothetical protein